MLQLSGLSMIMVTPFRDDETLDLDSVQRLTDWGIEQGVSSLVPLAIMGESHRLLDREREAVVAAVVAANAGRVPVVVGCSSESTYLACSRVEAALAGGADAVMVAPPRNTAPGKTLLAHFAAASAAAGDRLMVLQDEPVTTGVKMGADFIAEVTGLDNITHVKVEESPSAPKISAILDAAPGVRCLGGLGGLYTIEEVSRGAVGVMTGFGVPKVLVDILAAWRDGDRDRATEIFYHYLPLIRYEAQLGVGGVAIRKRLLYERGVIGTPVVRRPGAGAEERTVQELKGLLDRFGLGSGGGSVR